MRRRHYLSVIVAAFALLFTANCTQPADPSDDDGDSDGNGTATSTGGDTNGSTDDGSTTSMTTADATSDGGTGTTTGDGGTGTATGGDGGTSDGSTTGDGGTCEVAETGGGGDGDAGGKTCEIATDFTGQVGSSEGHGGGNAASSTDVLPEDTGIQAVLTWIENNQAAAEEDGGTSLPDGEQIEVQGAIVNATSFGDLGNRHFWIQDQQAATHVRLESAPGSGDTLKVGDAVTFTVTDVSVFAGQPQIAGVTDFGIDSSGNDVPIQEVDESTIDPSMYNQLVRTGGKLLSKWKCDSDERNCCGERCQVCYELVDNQNETIATFRSNAFTQEDSKGYFPDSCITFVGPLSMFPGPLASGDNLDSERERLRLQETNYGWTQQPGDSQ